MNETAHPYLCARVCARLSGVAANCASALAQMAAASCVQEEKEEKEVGETGDAITQGMFTETQRQPVAQDVTHNHRHTHTIKGNSWHCY